MRTHNVNHVLMRIVQTAIVINNIVALVKMGMILTEIVNALYVKIAIVKYVILMIIPSVHLVIINMVMI
jgi:hypothetical protein